MDRQGLSTVADSHSTPKYNNSSGSSTTREVFTRVYGKMIIVGLSN
jgi:hypothetical protein